MNSLAEKPESYLNQDGYIDLAALWMAAWRSRLLIIVATALIGVASVVATLSMPNVYRSSVLVAPVAQERQRGLSTLSGGLGALAGLAGINLSGVVVDNATLAMQTLTSRAFLTEFAKRHELVVPLFAAREWDIERQRWIIDSRIYDQDSGKWLRSVSPPAEPTPSDWEIYEVFSKMVTVEQDPKTSMIRVAVESRSPVAAKHWAEMLVRDINDYMRERDLAEASRSIQHLERRLEQTSISEMRMTTFQLIEEQMKIAMLAEARPEYVFRVVDPAVVPAEKSGPKRALICVLATLVGGLVITVAIIFLRLRGVISPG
jgi:uncharacterized protein involved in exopolysaccharide biosynthesis